LIAHSVLADLPTSIPEGSTSLMPVASVAMPVDDYLQPVRARPAV
jgi:hypothetical protein